MINSSLFYNSIEPAFIVRDLEIQEVNPAFLKLLKQDVGVKNPIMLSDILSDTGSDDKCSLNHFKNLVVLAEQEGNSEGNIQINDYKGNKLNVQILLTLFEGDKKEELIYIVIRRTFDDDSIGKLNAENRLLKQELHNISSNNDPEIDFKTLAEVTPSVIMQFDTSFKHVYVNSKVKEVTGIPAEDFIGKTHEEMEFPEPLVRLWKLSLNQVINTKEPHRIEFMLPNGVHLDWHLAPVFNQYNEVTSIISAAHDITSLKRVEEELRQAKEKLSDAMKMAHLSTWEFDLKSRKILISDDYRELFGINPKTRSLSGETLLKKYVFPDDQNLIIDVYHKAAAAKESDYKNYFEYRGLRNGQIIHTLASIRIIKNASGEISKCYGTVQDITQLRKNEEELAAYRTNLERLVEERTLELQKSEAKLSDALKLVSLGTWEYDFLSNQFNIGDEVVAMVTGKDGNGLGNSFSTEEFLNFLHPDDQPLFRNTTSFILKIKNSDFVEYLEIRIIRPDGEIRNLYISLKIIVDENGRHTKHYGTIQDITKIRRIEAEKERLIAISEATSDIIIISNIKGYILYLNKAGLDFFGLEQPVSIGKINIHDLQHRKNKKILKKVGLGQAIRKGIWSGENFLYGKDGNEIPVSQVIIAHRSTENIVECYSTILRDNSKQKKTEQDLISKNNELDTFVYRASHDLRGPIASLLGLHNVVKFEVSDPVSLKYFEMYNQQILRLNNIIISLIEISRIKDKEATKVDIDFQNLIEECITSFSNLPNFKNIRFAIQIDENLKFKSDISIITTILQNLIENAIKYSKPQEDSEVKIEIRDMANTLSIIVIDKGIGIDSSIQDKVFNMFFRGTEQAIGSGLGLYILKNAVEKLKGKIILDSILHKGTKFEIIIPY